MREPTERPETEDFSGGNVEKIISGFILVIGIAVVSALIILAIRSL